MGGLGERVIEEDLRKTFSSMGSVESVNVIRTKGRSFAYINFLPSSQNSLAKLFSTYNGCSWKGGKLKLEKAKEHYVDRLKREWAEDAELENGAHDHGEVDGNIVASVEPTGNLDLEKSQIRIFFPKLRKVKSLPLRGTGKHKYSFQRVEVPSLPVHMCDCCLEHSGPVQTCGEKLHNVDIQDRGINEEEINMMNSVMNKILKRESCSRSEHSCLPRETNVQDSEMQDGVVNDEEINLIDSDMKKLFNMGSSLKTEHDDPQDHSQQSNPTTSFPVHYEIDNGTDDDDIKINLATGQDDAPFLDGWGLQTNLVNETARSNERLTVNGLATRRNQASQEKKVKSSNKKRKSLSDESIEKDLASPKPKKKARLQIQSNNSEELLENPNSVTDPGTKTSSKKIMWSQKSAWKELVGDCTTSSFSMSHVTPDGKSNDEESPKTDNEGSSQGEEHKGVNNVILKKADRQSPPPKDPDEPLTAHPTGQSSGADKSTRGSSWLQKSSWTQLVGGQSSSSFSISQIVPTNMLEKQDFHKPITFVTIKEPTSVRTTLNGYRGSKPSLATSNKKVDQIRTSRDVGQSEASNGNHLSDETTEKKPSLERKQVSNALAMIGLGVRVSETCPFMRVADSLKERTTAKKKRNDDK